MARGVVVRIGDKTVMGRIASLTSGVDSGPTPMAREIQEFIHLVSFIAIFTGVVIFSVAMVTSFRFHLLQLRANDCIPFIYRFLATAGLIPVS